MEEILLSVSQVAIILKVHPLTIRRYIKEGRIKALRLAGNVRIPQSSLDNFSQIVTPSSYKPRNRQRVKEDKRFEMTDPIFRLKARGLSIRSIG